MIRWGGVSIAVSSREEKVYRDLRMMMRFAKKGNKIHLFLLQHRFLACVERALGRTGDAGLEGGGAAHEGGGAGLGRGNLGGDDGLGHGVHSEHGHDLLFCFETVFWRRSGRKAGRGVSACACDLTGERGWTGQRDRHGVCSRAMSTLDGRRDGSSIPRRARDRSVTEPRSEIRYFSRGDRPIARFLRTVSPSAGWLNRGRTRRKAAGGGIARHDVMGAGVSTHLVGCSTKCAGRAGRPGEEEKLVSCYRVSVFPL